jgi:hypothetical protein
MMHKLYIGLNVTVTEKYIEEHKPVIVKTIPKRSQFRKDIEKAKELSLISATINEYDDFDLACSNYEF